MVRILKLKDRIVRQLVIPLSLRSKLLEEYHDHSGHQGFFKTFSKLRDNAFWPGYELETRNYVRSCPKCQLNPWSSDKSKLVTIRFTHPFEIMEWDIIGPLCTTPNQNRYVLCCVDLFTKYAIAIPLLDAKAETLCDKLIEHILCKFGKPNRIHSDNGRNFASDIISTVCCSLKIALSHTTPYHPQGNGAVERFNRTLKHMLSKIDDPESWDSKLPMLLNNYNNQVNDSTGFSPFQLLFGKKPNFSTIPIELAPSTSGPTTHSYLCRLKRDLASVQKTAAKNLKKSSIKNRKTYNRRTPAQHIPTNSQILYKNPATGSWSGPFIVTAKLGPSTYSITINDRITTVHRNNIKPYYPRSCQGGM